MENHADSDEPERTVPCRLLLHPITIERVFTDCIMDLHRIIVLDGIDIVPNGFRVRCHDLHGQLPEIVINNCGNTFEDKDRLANETCKLIAVSRLRDRMVRFLPRCRFLKPTHMDGKAVVGMRAGPLTRIGEGVDYITAYYELHRQVLG